MAKQTEQTSFCVMACLLPNCHVAERSEDLGEEALTVMLVMVMTMMVVMLMMLLMMMLMSGVGG